MYQIHFTDDAEHDLDRLDRQVQQRILKRLDWLAEHAAQTRHEQVTGPLAGLFKFRVGDYRVPYDLLRADRVILVHVVRYRHNLAGSSGQRYPSFQKRRFLRARYNYAI